MFIPLVGLLCDQLECVVENLSLNYLLSSSYSLLYIALFILYVAAYMANKVVYIASPQADQKVKQKTSDGWRPLWMMTLE